MKQNKHFHVGVKRILRHDKRYAGEAFHFIHRAVHFAHKMKVKSGKTNDIHVSCEELLDGIRRFAIQEYGPLTMRVFEVWRILATEDFGNIVFLMADEGLIGVNENDRLEQFRDVFDFHDSFVKPFMPSGKRVHVPVIAED